MRVRLFPLVAASLLAVAYATSAQDPSGESIVPDGFDLQGHRGARGLVPENTIPAFRRALELGVTTLEMDVVISKDGQVVVSHEPWMSHEICSLPSGAPIAEEEARSHNLYRMTYAEIEQYDCGQRRHPDFPRQETQPAVKPLLRDVIAMAESYVAEHERSLVYYNIEIKSRPAWDEEFHPPPKAFARRVLEVVREADATSRTTLQSFDLRALRAPREVRAEQGGNDAVQLSLLVGREAAGRLAEQLDRLGFTPAVYSPAYPAVDQALLQAAHDRGLRVVPWTVNERTDMRRLIRLGVDGLITDVPDVGMEVVEAMAESSD